MRKYQNAETVSKIIQNLKETPDSEVAAQLLFDLYQEEQLYYIPNDGTPLLVYSHAELARAPVFKVDGASFLEFAAASYMNGDFDIILNSTDTDGLCVPILSFMDLVCTNILQCPEIYPCTDQARVMEALYSLKSQLSISTARMPHDMSLTIWERGALAEKPNKKAVLEQCGFDRLLQIAAECPAALVRIYTNGQTLDTTTRTFLAAAHACKLVDGASPRVGLDKIALRFVDADWKYADSCSQPENEIIDLSFTDEQNSDSVKESKVKNLLSKIKSHMFSKEHKISEEKSSIKKSFVGVKFIAAILFAIIFVVVSGWIVYYFLTPTPLETVQETIKTGNYEQLPDDYQNCVASDKENKKILITIMEDDLNSKIESYAANELTTAEIAKVLVAYKKIPDMAESAAAAYQKASALEQSKLAYKRGLESSSIFDRLTNWRSVSKSDTGSMTAMVANLTNNVELYKEKAFAEIETQSDKVALSNLCLFQSFYENDTEISDKIKELQNRAFSATVTIEPQPSISGSEVQPVWDQAPIVITKFSLRQEGYEGWNIIYLDWSNRTDQVISSIVFELYPYDREGNCVSTLVDTGDGLYSKYQAKFDGPFNSMQNVNGYYFTNVWCNSAVAQARLDAVIITYADGTITTFYNSTDIAGLFSAK